mmetsp:Transcript_119733/g.211669  ORF Transcript_119733/g.211669 Transcript_119733/m.211669 type:complete len:404 (-) Transcript_119733:248-1459(-)
MVALRAAWDFFLICLYALKRTSQVCPSCFQIAAINTRSVYQACKIRGLVLPKASALDVVDEAGRTSVAALAEELAVRAEEFLGCRGVDGSEKLARAIRREGLAAQKAATCSVLNGVRNNLAGMGAELSVAVAAPEVVAVRKRFPGCDGVEGVEVDVVAQRGATWIEVKYVTGVSLDMDQLKCQVAALMANAALPGSAVSYSPPTVCVLLAGGSSCQESVRDELQQMGAVVLEAAEALPPAPPPLSHAVLDVFSLCALCSEVTNGGATSPEVSRWAGTQERYANCVAEELRAPLRLPSKLSGLVLDTSDEVVARFEAILEVNGGLRERERWFGEGGWKGRIRVHGPRDPHADGSGMEKSHLLELGRSLRAIVVTANSRGVRRLRSGCQVAVEFLEHRPVWLAGV